MTAENIMQSIDDRLADNEKEVAELVIDQADIEKRLAELRAETDKLASVRAILVGPGEPVGGTKAQMKTKASRKASSKKSAKSGKSTRTKLNQEIADTIRATEDKSVSELAREYGVSRQAISNIRSGKSWAPDKLVVTNGEPTPEFKAGLSANVTRRNKLNQETADAIRSAEGTLKSIAQTYNVSPTTVNNIRKGRIWTAQSS